MSVRRSLVLASAASNGAALIGFASSMILARLMIPSEVGVFSIAAALIGLVSSLRDFGVSAYLIRSPQLDRAKIAASYGVMIVASWGLALIIALASPLAATIYRDARVGDLMLILALNLMLVPFGALTMAYLTREMRFGAQFVLNISSALANAGIAIALAWLGYGAYSLAWAGLGSTLTTILVSFLYRPDWWPWLPTLKGWREVVSFGAPVTGGALAGHLNSAAVDLITGQMIGPEAVALYGKAQSIRGLFEQFFMVAIRLVALPHFATLVRNNVGLRSTYLVASNMLTGIGWPFAALLLVLAEPLVLLLFGNSWLGSAPLLIWTALWMIISLPGPLIHSVLIAMGHAESLLKAELTMLSVKIVVVVLAAPMGIEAVAIALLLQSCIYVLVWSSRLRTAIGLNLFDLLRAQLNSAPPALACGIAAYFGREYCQHLALPPLPTVALCMTLGGLVWLASIWAVHHPLAAEILRLSRAMTVGRSTK